ncbi:hypothetical protein ES703_97893 [subsurface metagenome]
MVGHDGFHFRRYTRQYKKGGGPRLKLQPRRRAYRVRQSLRFHWNFGLGAVASRDFESPLLEALYEDLPVFLVKLQVTVKIAAECGLGDVIVGRAQSPGCDHQLQLAIPPGQHLLDGFQVIAYGGLRSDNDALSEQFLGQPYGVGVNAESGDDLIAYGKDARLHISILTALITTSVTAPAARSSSIIPQPPGRS